MTPGLESPTVSPLHEPGWSRCGRWCRAARAPGHGRALRARRPGDPRHRHPRLPAVTTLAQTLEVLLDPGQRRADHCRPPDLRRRVRGHARACATAIRCRRVRPGDASGIGRSPRRGDRQRLRLPRRLGRAGRRRPCGDGLLARDRGAPACGDSAHLWGYAHAGGHPRLLPDDRIARAAGEHLACGRCGSDGCATRPPAG